MASASVGVANLREQADECGDAEHWERQDARQGLCAGKRATHLL